jgi:hypothetical protein
MGLGGKCLTASGSGADGTRLTLSDCTGAANQTFSLRGQISGIGGKCVNAMGSAANPFSWHGNATQMWTCRGTANQEWLYVP